MSAIDPFTDMSIASTLADPRDAATRSSMFRYLGDLRRRWPVVVAGGVLGLILGLLYLGNGQSVTATTDVDVSSAPALSAVTSSNAGFDAGTDIGIATSYPVAAAAALALGGGVDPAVLRSNMEATAVDGTPIVHIEYTDDSPAVARERADAIARAYLTFRDQAVAAAFASTDTKEPASASLSRVLTSAADNPVSSPTTPLAVAASGAVAGAVVGALVALALAARRRQRETRADVVRRVGPVLADADASAMDGEALARLARERILMRTATTLERLAVVDVSDSGEGLLVPHELAAAFRALDWDCVVERGSENARTDEEFEFAPLRIHAAGPHAPLDEMLRTARGTDGVVIVHDPGRAGVDSAAALASELRAAGASMLGAIIVARTRPARRGNRDRTV